MVWTPTLLTSLAAWYDPSDFTTLWQDSAKTTPVTASGQSIGFISDKSGNAHHLSQATAGSRPTLGQDANGKYYINFAGGYLTEGTTNINQNSTFLFASAMVQPTGAGGMIWTCSTQAGNENIEFSYSSNSTGYEFSGRRLNTDGFSVFATGTADTALRSVIGVHDYSGATTSIYIDGALTAGPTASQTAGSTANSANTGSAIGGWIAGGFGITGNVYQLVVGHALSASERTSLDTFLKASAGISSGPVFSPFDSSMGAKAASTPPPFGGFSYFSPPAAPPPSGGCFSHWGVAVANPAIRNSPRPEFSDFPVLPPPKAATPTNIFFAEWFVAGATPRPPRDFSSFIKQQAPPTLLEFDGWQHPVAPPLRAQADFSGFVSTTAIPFTPGPMAAYSAWTLAALPQRPPFDFSGFISARAALPPVFSAWGAALSAARPQVDFSGFVSVPTAATQTPGPMAAYAPWVSSPVPLKSPCDFGGFVPIPIPVPTPGPMSAFSPWVSSPVPLKSPSDFGGFVAPTAIPFTPGPMAAYSQWVSSPVPLKSPADFGGFVPLPIPVPTPGTMAAFAPWVSSPVPLKSPSDFGGFVPTTAIAFTPGPMAAHSQWVASPVPLKSPADFGGFVAPPPVAKAPLFQYEPWASAPLTQAARQSAMIAFGWPPHAVFPPPPPPPPGGSSGQWEIIKTTIPEPTRSWEFSPLPWVSPPTTLIDVDGVYRPKHKPVKRAGPKPDYSIYNRPTPPVVKEPVAPTPEPVKAAAEAPEALIEAPIAPAPTPELEKKRAPGVLLPLSDLGAVAGAEATAKKTAAPLVPPLPALPALPVKQPPAEEKPKAEEAVSEEEEEPEALIQEEEEKKPSFDDEADLKAIHQHLTAYQQKLISEYRALVDEIINDAKEIERILGISR